MKKMVTNTIFIAYFVTLKLKMISQNNIFGGCNCMFLLCYKEPMLKAKKRGFQGVVIFWWFESEVF